MNCCICGGCIPEECDGDHSFEEQERQYWLDQREEEFLDATEAEHAMEDSLEHPLR